MTDERNYDIDGVVERTLEKIEKRKKLDIIVRQKNARNDDYKSKAARMAESPFNIKL